MSVVISLVPLAIAIGVSLTGTSVGLLTMNRVKKNENLPPVETAFMDASVLQKTLSEHGLHVNRLSENEFTIETESGMLHYFRSSEDAPFQLEVKGVRDMEQLLDSLDSLENEYGRNVQAFTYDKVMCSLAEHGMAVEEEEVLPDDSIVITLKC